MISAHLSNATKMMMGLTLQEWPKSKIHHLRWQSKTLENDFKSISQKASW